jgi:hypothetical protein
MKSRAVVTWVVLALWVLAGPFATAFGACAAMGAMCEGPCGAAPGIVVVTLPGGPLPGVTGAPAAAAGTLPGGTRGVPDPPPRLLLDVA